MSKVEWHELPVSDGEIYPHFQLLNPKACAGWVERIDALKAHWTPRSGGLFFTLGTAGYLDAPDAASAEAYSSEYMPPDHYYTQIAVTNPLLEAHFSDLHQQVAKGLEKALGRPVSYCEDKALPGFHIFPDAAEFAEQSNHVPHYDRQFSNLDWSTEPGADFTRSLSFTLTLDLPASGGGLKLWRLNYYRMMELSKEEAIAKLRTTPCDTITYEIGGVICHSGNELHQIVPWRARPGERRITMQGHGLLTDAGWRLYW